MFLFYSRAEASCSKLAELNPYVEVRVFTKPLEENLDFLKEFQVMLWHTPCLRNLHYIILYFHLWPASTSNRGSTHSLNNTILYWFDVSSKVPNEGPICLKHWNLFYRLCSEQSIWWKCVHPIVFTVLVLLHHLVCCSHRSFS